MISGYLEKEIQILYQLSGCLHIDSVEYQLPGSQHEVFHWVSTVSEWVQKGFIDSS